MATTLTQGWELTKRAKDGIFLVTFFDADGKRKRLSTGARSEREAYAKAPQIVAGKTAKQIAKVELVTKADPEIVQPVMTMNRHLRSLRKDGLAQSSRYAHT